jgi:hypothetical protein
MDLRLMIVDFGFLNEEGERRPKIAVTSEESRLCEGWMLGNIF